MRATGLGERVHGPTTHAQHVSEWLMEPHELAECRDPGLVARAVAAACAWLALPYALPEPRLVSLGIADLNPANVLWDGELCRLVDFEDGELPIRRTSSPTTSSTSPDAGPASSTVRR